MKFSTLAALRKVFLVFPNAISSAEQGSQYILGGCAVCSSVLVELKKLSSPYQVRHAHRFLNDCATSHVCALLYNKTHHRAGHLQHSSKPVQLFLIAISAILTVKIMFKMHIYDMKIFSLITTKSKESSVFPNTYFSLQHKYLVNVLMPQSEIVSSPSSFKTLVSSLECPVLQCSLP